MLKAVRARLEHQYFYTQQLVRALVREVVDDVLHGRVIENVSEIVSARCLVGCFFVGFGSAFVRPLLVTRVYASG